MIPVESMPVVGYFVAVIYSVVLVSLDNIQEALENPYDTLDEDDVDVTLSGGVLTIRGEKKREEEEKGKDYYRSERHFGSFRRSLPIPVDVDETKIEAEFKKGVLNIELPKTREARDKVKHIPIKAA